MKLLVITNNPDRASFRQRIELYLPALAAADIESNVIKLPKGTFARQKLFKKCRNYDGVFLHKKRLGLIDSAALRKNSRRIIYDFDDAIMFDSDSNSSSSSKRQKVFARTVKLADLVIAGNDYLADHARKFNANVEVLPTGLAIDDYNFADSYQNDGKVRLVWIGSKSTLMYLEYIRDILEQTGKCFDNKVILRIICDDFFELENMPVEKVNWTLENQGRDLCQCDIGLAPLSDDVFSRGKCGFKILQYMAASLPVIASGVGVNSEFAKDGIRGFTPQTNRQWLERLAELIENPQQRKQLGQNGRKWVSKFDTKTIGQQLVKKVYDCLSEAILT